MFCLSAPAMALTPAELADRLQASYDKTHDLRADFTQVSVVKAMNMTREGSGELVILKPGMLKYVYEKPEPQTMIVKDGKLTMYMPKARQVVVRNLDRELLDKTPSTFLAGLGKITDSFEVSFPETGPTDADGNHVLRLVPKGEKMNISHIDLTVSPDGYDILGFSFAELTGNLNTVRLNKIKINKGVDASEFGFDIPMDATLISE